MVRRFSLFTHFYPIVNLANPWHGYVVCFVWRSLANPCHWDHPGAHPISAYSFHWKKFIFESVFILWKRVDLECTKEYGGKFENNIEHLVHIKKEENELKEAITFANTVDSLKSLLSVILPKVAKLRAENLRFEIRK